jgi:hypothetical protein
MNNLSRLIYHLGLSRTLGAQDLASKDTSKWNEEEIFAESQTTFLTLGWLKFD